MRMVEGAASGGTITVPGGVPGSTWAKDSRRFRFLCLWFLFMSAIFRRVTDNISYFSSLRHRLHPTQLTTGPTIFYVGGHVFGYPARRRGNSSLPYRSTAASVFLRGNWRDENYSTVRLRHRSQSHSARHRSRSFYAGKGSGAPLGNV